MNTSLPTREKNGKVVWKSPSEKWAENHPSIRFLCCCCFSTLLPHMCGPVIGSKQVSDRLTLSRRPAGKGFVWHGNKERIPRLATFHKEKFWRTAAKLFHWRWASQTTRKVPLLLKSLFALRKVALQTKMHHQQTNNLIGISWKNFLKKKYKKEGKQTSRLGRCTSTSRSAASVFQQRFSFHLWRRVDAVCSSNCHRSPPSRLLLLPADSVWTKGGMEGRKEGREKERKKE